MDYVKFIILSGEPVLQQPWSLKTAATIVKQAGPDGIHPEIAKRWAYVPGMMLMAIARTGEQYQRDEYFDFMKRHMDLFVQEDGSIKTYRLEEYNLDQINQGKNLFMLLERTGEERYAKAAHRLATQLAGHPRTTEGGFWHKKIYPFQMWLDGLYMSSPFLDQYAKVFNRPELFDEVAHQILYIEQKTRDPQTGLLYHGWDEARSGRIRLRAVRPISGVVRLVGMSWRSWTAWSSFRLTIRNAARSSAFSSGWPMRCTKCKKRKAAYGFK